jgi:rSAM/selenodomain-associated transferase 2
LPISVIIPALDEEAFIAQALSSAASGDDVELIVADGGSSDRTTAVARHAGVRVISAPPGRGSQMNAAAAEATGDALLFLHADARLPLQYDRHLRETLERPGVVAGAFELAVDGPQRSLRVLERLVRFRSRRLGMPYGDQGLFLRSATFRDLGGFPELEVMEDFELVRRLRRRGRIEIVPAPIVTSARRWLSQGVLRTTLLNQCLIAAHLLGVPSRRLAAWRRPAGAAPAVSRPACSRSASP